MPNYTTLQAAILPSLGVDVLVFAAAVPPLALVLAGTAWPERLDDRRRKLLAGLALLLAVGCILIELAWVAKNVRQPRDWDFKHFWTWGVAVVEGTSPYDHENLLRIAEPLEPGEDLQNELYCFYPPPTLLLFAPLGWLPFRVALVVWEVVQAIALAASLALMVRMFLNDRSPRAAAPLIALALAFYPTAATFYLAQSNFLVLLALVLFWRDRERPRAGVWLALGCLVKPLAAAPALYLLLRGRWRALAVMAGVLAVFALATAAALGPGIFAEFAAREGVSSAYPLVQDWNQSLAATVLRATGATGDAKTLLASPLVLGAIAAVIAATAAMIMRLRDDADPYAVGLSLAMMLMIYPGTLAHYAVHLLPPLALVLGRLSESGGRRAWLVLAMSAVVLLAALKLTFWSMLLVWIVLAVEGLRVAHRQARLASPA